MTSNTKNNKKELAAIEKRMEREIFGTVSTVRGHKHCILVCSMWWHPHLAWYCTPPVAA